MKKVIVIVFTIMISCGLGSWAGNAANYVKSGDNFYFGQDVKVGANKTKIISADGTIVKIPNKKVDAYMKDSRLFELKTVDNRPDGSAKKYLMEKLSTRNGLILYSYLPNNNKILKNIYYVFADGKLYLECSEINTASVLQYFGVDIVL